MATRTDDIVVFLNPDGKPFSMDPRWQDSRVRDTWNKKSQAEPEETEELENEGSDDEEEEYDDDYGNWTNDELRAELNKRKLSLDGKKADLVARLEKDDEKGA